MYIIDSHTHNISQRRIPRKICQPVRMIIKFLRIYVVLPGFLNFCFHIHIQYFILKNINQGASDFET